MSEGQNGRMELADANFYIQMDAQQGPLQSTGKYIQYPVINHTGKEYIKKRMYYIYMYN